ncbi:MAG: hypothetical protein ACD_62C00692G0004 [uncultured bacterium]|nr:MAG: hypothetical protein ACD_62C00692G0004 [uncultured bacterium]
MATMTINCAGIYQQYSSCGFEPTVARVLRAQDAVGLPEEAYVHRLIAERRPTTVLDIGCGYGGFVRALAKKAPGVRFVGIDNDAQRISAALSNPGMENVSLHSASIQDKETREEFLPNADIALMRYTYQHINDPTLLGQIKPLLKKGALVLVIEGYQALNHEYPRRGPYTDFLRRLEAFYEKIGSDIHVAPQLPVLFRQAGYHHVNMDLLGCSNLSEGIEEAFFDMIIGTAWLIHTVDSTIMSKDVVEALALNLEVHQKDTLFTMPSALVSGIN